MKQDTVGDAGTLARKRKALLAGGLVLGLGASATLAAWSDDAWVSATFNTGSAAQVRLQSSTSPDGPFADHSTTGALELPDADSPHTVGFTTPISLAPGQTSYSAVYLRTSAETAQPMSVSIAEAQKMDTVDGSGATTNAQLWGEPGTNGLITYGARATLVDSITSPPRCDESLFSRFNPFPVRLIGTDGGLLGTQDGLVSLDSAPSGDTFTLDPTGASTYMVCFRFSLASAASSAAPSVNGASISPYWVFSGVAL